MSLASSPFQLVSSRYVLRASITEISSPTSTPDPVPLLEVPGVYAKRQNDDTEWELEKVKNNHVFRETPHDDKTYMCCCGEYTQDGLAFLSHITYCKPEFASICYYCACGRMYSRWKSMARHLEHCSLTRDVCELLPAFDIEMLLAPDRTTPTQIPSDETSADNGGQDLALEGTGFNATRNDGKHGPPAGDSKEGKLRHREVISWKPVGVCNAGSNPSFWHQQHPPNPAGLLSRRGKYDCESNRVTEELGDVTKGQAIEADESQESPASVDSDLLSVSDFDANDEGIGPAQPSGPFVFCFGPVVEKTLIRFADWQRLKANSCAGEHSSSGRQPEVPPNTNPEKKPSARRSRPQDDNPNDGQDDIEPSLAVVKRQKTSQEPAAILACPFWKRDCAKHSKCYRYKLSRIRDVKLHLHRCHASPWRCIRCRTSFPNEAMRDGHLRADPPCKTRDLQDDASLSQTQLDALRRKSDSKLTKERQWFAIWNIVFPGRPRPLSPYIGAELSHDLSQFREFWQINGADIVSEALNTSGLYNMSQEERNQHSQYLLSAALDAIFEKWLSARSSQAVAPKPETPATNSSSREEQISTTTPSQKEANLTPSLVVSSTELNSMCPPNIPGPKSEWGEQSRFAAAEDLFLTSPSQLTVEEMRRGFDFEDFQNFLGIPRDDMEVNQSFELEGNL